VPQLVIPRTTPPEPRTRVPAVLAILEYALSELNVYMTVLELLFDLVHAATGPDLCLRVSPGLSSIC